MKIRENLPEPVGGQILGLHDLNFGILGIGAKLFH